MSNSDDKKEELPDLMGMIRGDYASANDEPLMRPPEEDSDLLNDKPSVWLRVDIGSGWAWLCVISGDVPVSMQIDSGVYKHIVSDDTLPMYSMSGARIVNSPEENLIKSATHLIDLSSRRSPKIKWWGMRQLGVSHNGDLFIDSHSTDTWSISGRITVWEFARALAKEKGINMVSVFDGMAGEGKEVTLIPAFTDTVRNPQGGAS